jgi:hypothetical protein
MKRRMASGELAAKTGVTERGEVVIHHAMKWEAPFVPRVVWLVSKDGVQYEYDAEGALVSRRGSR